MTRCRAARTIVSANRRLRAEFRRHKMASTMYPDIDQARVLHAGLKAMVDRSVGSESDYRALRRALDLCRRARAAVDDGYCRDKLRLVEDFAAELFSHGANRAQFLKAQILAALELFASRLYSLEMRRRGAVRATLAKIAPLRA